MRHILKASFEQQGDGQHLLDELLAAGYTQASLALSGATHSGSFTRQRHAVTLAVDSDEEAQRVLALMERSHPARLQDNLQDQDAIATGSVSLDGRSAQVPQYRPGTEPGALQFHRLEDSRLFGTQDAAAPPAGTTFQDRMGSADLWDAADESLRAARAKAVWSVLDVGENDQERAAYRFGKTMRTDDRYRNRAWDEAEPSLKADWASSSPDACAWADVRASVRHGWDFSTPEIDDDSHYRAHWTTRYAPDVGAGSGDDATPTYMDDSEARRSERYRSKAPAHTTAHDASRHSAWDRFEDAIQHAWTRTDVGSSDGSDGAPWTWHKVKEAVRHGWDRVRS